MATIHVNIEGKLAPFGNGRLLFISADTRDDRASLVWLVYVLDRQQKAGIRLDLDKRAVIDQIGDEKLDAEIKLRQAEIWKVVVTERRVQRPKSFAFDPLV